MSVLGWLKEVLKSSDSFWKVTNGTWNFAGNPRKKQISPFMTPLLFQFFRSWGKFAGKPPILSTAPAQKKKLAKKNRTPAVVLAILQLKDLKIFNWKTRSMSVPVGLRFVAGAPRNMDEIGTCFLSRRKGKFVENTKFFPKNTPCFQECSPHFMPI